MLCSESSLKAAEFCASHSTKFDSLCFGICCQSFQKPFQVILSYTEIVIQVSSWIVVCLRKVSSLIEKNFI